MLLTQQPIALLTVHLTLGNPLHVGMCESLGDRSDWSVSNWCGFCCVFSFHMSPSLWTLPHPVCPRVCHRIPTKREYRQCHNHIPTLSTNWVRPRPDQQSFSGNTATKPVAVHPYNAATSGSNHRAHIVWSHGLKSFCQDHDDITALYEAKTQFGKS